MYGLRDRGKTEAPLEQWKLQLTRSLNLWPISFDSQKPTMSMLTVSTSPRAPRERKGLREKSAKWYGQGIPGLPPQEACGTRQRPGCREVDARQHCPGQ
jgi:hypothetical protein